MELQTTIYLVVGLSFALYIGIAIWARAGSTSEFYVAGGGVLRLEFGDCVGLAHAALTGLRAGWRPRGPGSGSAGCRRSPA